jgi:hypothetical protein
MKTMTRGSLTLYELSQEYGQALEVLTDPEAEIPLEAVEDTLEGLAGELQEKAIHVALFMRNLEVTVQAIQEAEAQMAKRRKALESRARWLRDYLKRHLEAVGIHKIDSPWFRLAVRKNPEAVDVVDLDALPDELVSLEVRMSRAVYQAVREQLNGHCVKSEKAERSTIKTRLKAGETVPGARLKQDTRLAVY